MQSMPTRTIYDVASKQEASRLDAGVVLEGTAPWMGRRNNHLLYMAENGVRIGRVVLGASERPLIRLRK